MSTKYPRKFYQKRFFYNDEYQQVNERESYVLIFKHGSVEGWRTPYDEGYIAPSSHYGGIEVHSANHMYEGHEPMPGHCQYVQGGTCYHDGSSLAFEQIEHYFDAPEAMYEVLAGWESNIKKGSFGAMLNALAEGADES
jgi:hypothetical protein